MYDRCHLRHHVSEQEQRGLKRKPDDQVCVLIHCFTWLTEIKHISSVAVLTIKKTTAALQSICESRLLVVTI